MTQNTPRLTIDCSQLGQTQVEAAQHTPTPWKIIKTPDQVRKMGIDASDWFDIGDDSTTVCSTAYNDEKVNGANADFIVRACNAHDALVDALQKMLGNAEKEGIIYEYYYDGKDCAEFPHIKAAREALKLARGEF